MRNPGIFCRVLFFLGAVEQQVEAGEVLIVLDGRLGLLLLKSVYLVNGVEEIEYSWMLETNAEAIHSVAALPARLTRTFRIYERAI